MTYYEPEGFLSRYLDFQRGIRVGHLEPPQRITRILKQALEEKFQESFVTDRYGRGVYWQWICFLSRANRASKPLSHHTNFGCAKFFISIDREEVVFKSGLQVERGYLTAVSGRQSWQLQRDWDWHRMEKALEENSGFLRGLRRLLKKEGFHLKLGSWEKPRHITPTGCPPASHLLDILRGIPAAHWGGFQLYYPMSPQEVAHSDGPDLVEAMMAVFIETTPLMNQCMQTRLKMD